MTHTKDWKTINKTKKNGVKSLGQGKRDRHTDRKTNRYTAKIYLAWYDLTCLIAQKITICFPFSCEIIGD